MARDDEQQNQPMDDQHLDEGRPVRRVMGRLIQVMVLVLHAGKTCLLVLGSAAAVPYALVARIARAALRWLAHVLASVVKLGIARLQARLQAPFQAVFPPMAHQVGTVWTRVDDRWLRHPREWALSRVDERTRAARIGVARWVQSHWDRLTRRYGKRKVQQVALVVLLVATIVCGPLSLLGTLHLFSSFTPGTPGTPHQIDPQAGTQPIQNTPPQPQQATPPKPFDPHSQRPAMAHGFVPHMQPSMLFLDPTSDATFVGSDGRLEVDVPAGAVSAADARAAADNSVELRITEIGPTAGSNAGGSGVVTLGSYRLEVVDGKGNRLNHGLRKAATIKLHYASKEEALDLDHAFVVFNGAHLKTVSGLGAPLTRKATHDAKDHVLVAQWDADPSLAAAATETSAAATTGSMPVLSGLESAAQHVLRSLASLVAQQSTLNQTQFTFNTYAPVAKYGAPDPFNVDLNAGTLTEGIKLDVPPGPAQAMPNLTLAYNSGAVSEQHSPQGAAGWAGEGWSLSLGAISWAEHNVYANCYNRTSSTCPGNLWQNSWELTDPFGTSTELIPPRVDTSTYYDDTPATYCASGISTSVACPIQFQTARQSYAKVYAYVSNISWSTPGHPTLNPSCFRVYLANGVMEEFGCTTDSLQYYVVPNSGIIGGTTNATTRYPANWYLDLITNPQGDQVHITYQQDMAQASDGDSYPRDVVPATIEWDSPTCVSSSQECTGSSSPNQWAPHYRVQFTASHAPTRLTNTPSGCNTGQNLRCDDPQDLLGSGGVSAPQVNGTFVLNDAAVQTNLNGAWQTVRDYQMSYEQSGPSTRTDPITGLSESTAGYLDLTKVQEIGDDGSTTAPAQTFGYTSLPEYYEDGSYAPTNGICGPIWNQGVNGGGCDLWSETYDGNSRYLATAANGQGLAQTFSWQLARNNTHGVYGSSNPNDIANPLYCNGQGTQGSYPCNEADDQAWSRAVVTARTDAVAQETRQGQDPNTQPTTTTINSTSGYSYQLTYPLAAQECTDCVAGMYWGNQNDGDYLDYYNGHFMGFAETWVANPDGSMVDHQYEATEGWGVYDTSIVTSCPSTLPPVTTTCHASPWWNVANAGHGLEHDTYYYATDGKTVLKHDSATYTAVCPAGGASATPIYSTTINGTSEQWGPWDGMQVSALDLNNPVAVCDVRQATQKTEMQEGSGSTVTETDSYTYDSYGRVQSTTRTGTNSGSSASTQIVTNTGYTQINSLSVPPQQRTNSSQEGEWGSGLYLLDLPTSRDTEYGGGTQAACSATGYDGAGNATTQDAYKDCTNKGGTTLQTTTTYDTLGNAVASTDPNRNGGATCPTVGGGNASGTSCTTYGNTTAAQTTGTTNAAGQSSGVGYDTSAAGGYGLWPVSTTDASAQTTAYTYDALGRVTSTSLPGESGPWTTSTTYANWCSGSSAQTPCVEVDTKQHLDTNGDVTISRSFYDGAGRLVETRTSAPDKQDVVQYSLYNAAGRLSAQSVKYYVAAYTGAAGSAAYSIPDSSVTAQTTDTYDGLGRTTQVIDALSFPTTTSYAVICNAPGTTSGDTNCYEQTLVVDANHHQHGTLADGLGRSIYAQEYTGTYTFSYAVYATTTYGYDAAGHVTSILYPDGVHSATATYDDAGRLFSTSDPDRGTEYDCYDNNGNQVLHADARSNGNGTSTCTNGPANTIGTTYTGYDSLNRPIWRNSTNSQAGAYATWSYVASGNGTGQLAGETFNGGVGGGNLGAGSYSYSYDVRGQQTGQSITLGGTSYTFATAYNDAGEPTSLTYSDGEVASYGYDGASGALTSLVTQPQGGSTSILYSAIAYGGTAGAAGLPTAATLGAGNGSPLTYQAVYDYDLRLDRVRLTKGMSTPFQSDRTYDGVGNVASVATTLPGGTDTQAFCYDEQNRLTWAGSTGTAPCAGSVPSGSLSGAAYGPDTFAYGTLNQLTNGPTGGYTYGDSAHLDAVTAIGSSYSASYDASGNMTCRAPTSSQTCSGGTPTGQGLTYDNEGRLTGWTGGSGSTASEAMAYDGEGNRVALVVNGATPTYYLGQMEEVNGSTVTKYFAVGGSLPTPMRSGTGGTIAYLATDGLGSVSEAVSASGSMTFQQLFTPYGTSRYSSGTSPTTKGFTGQRADSTSELDYYNARYYDPAAGQFTSADTQQDGLNRYAYVHGNPVTLSDPSGHGIRNCGVNSDICTGAGGTTVGTNPTTDGGSGKGENGGGQGCTANCGNGGTGGTGTPLSYTTSDDGETPPGCKRSCMISAIDTSIEGQVGQLKFGIDAFDFFESAVLFGVDLAVLTAAPTNVMGWVNLIGDGSALIASLLALVKDASIIWHWVNAAFEETLATLSAVFQALAAAANFVRAAAGIVFFFNPGELFREAGQLVASELKEVAEAIGGGIGQGGVNGLGAEISQLQLLELQVPAMTDDQLRDTCRQRNLQC